MKTRFKKEDIGKRVIWGLDPKNEDGISRFFGFDKVKLHGKITGTTESCVELIGWKECFFRYGIHSQVTETIQTIPYEHIMYYRWSKTK